MKIKLVVGERDELDRISQLKSRNGFYTFMWQLWARLDWDSGELELARLSILGRHFDYFSGSALRICQQKQDFHSENSTIWL